jgi:putative transferase (TIGR04331 family)
VSVIGHSGLDAGQALALHRRSGARIVARPNVPKDLPDSPPDAGRRQGLGGAGPPGDGLAALASRVIPDLLPTSVVEGAAHIAPRAEAAYGPPTHLLVGNYSTDELMNGHIAACAAAGRRVDHAQHGGFYLQARVNAQERLEIRDDSTFLAWRSTPNPHLERLRDTHRGGTDVVIVEGLNPPDPYVLRFASTPLGDQGWQSSELLEALVARTGLARSHLRLKRFPPVIPGVRYPPLLAGLPHQMPLGVHSATDWMARARVAVIAYPDTPLVQAIVLGVPVLGLWNPAFWELREDARRPFEELAAAGVLFSDPADAAARLDEVYDHADEWWASSEVAAAREAFIARFAPPGDWLGAWSAHLKGMGAG